MAELFCAKARLFDVGPYGHEAFFHALSNEFCPASSVAESTVANYLAGYLDAIGVQSMVVEHDYTDGDYLDDYSAYYVKCFASYPRRCQRLHFFSIQVDPNLVRLLIENRASRKQKKAFKQAYLGFVVARPLPEAVVGRTVLATYGWDGGRRHFAAIRSYRANLFGLELRVRSLAFQEQDTVLAACATVALWSALHKDAELFGTPIPTPATITRAANRIGHNSRPLPSRSLALDQICTAIESFGLEPEVIAVKPSTPLLSLIYGYIRFGLPVVVVGICDDGEGHAVTISGFSMRGAAQRTSEVAMGQVSISTIARRIDELYVHDDQLGPFAAMTLQRVERRKVPKIIKDALPDLPPLALVKRESKEKLYPVAAIIPVYPKIRLRLLDFQHWLTRLAAFYGPLSGNEWEWDLHLTSSNDYKCSVRASGWLPREVVGPVILRQHPRFLWRGILRKGAVRVLEVLGDATEIERSFPIYFAIWHDDAFATETQRLVEADMEFAAQTLSPLMLDFLLASIRQQKAFALANLDVPCELSESARCLFASAPGTTSGASIGRTCNRTKHTAVPIEPDAQHN